MSDDRQPGGSKSAEREARPTMPGSVMTFGRIWC